ncbi:MAG: glucose-1-phosphate adenylyltransferase [Anaerolineaceae bacterium]|nr:glucose-1-phosphate adenylyltransferase [Anaerolineaceae bacterium]
MAGLEDMLAVILGGGRGTRLFPLTKERSKPAVPMAGKYRLIDIPISNCINSGIIRIAVLTQFNSISLHRHITRTYNFDAFHAGWVQVWAAEQTVASSDWYQGTADAVRKQLGQIRNSKAKYVLILAGDHLYRMDYSEMAKFHVEKGADITIAALPASLSDASRFGILKRDPLMRITDFVEKPTTPEVQKQFISRNDAEKPLLASTGIYLFNSDVLCDLLENTTYDDFGGQVIPAAITTHKVYGFDFEGFWEDIGTIRSFYDTNLALTSPDAPFDFFDPERPIYTHPRFLPGSTVRHSVLENTLLAEGCSIDTAEIFHSVIGLRSQIRNGSVIRDTVMMGADYYDTGESLAASTIGLGIGRNCSIEGAIIDKNARIGEGTVVKPFPVGTDFNEKNWVVRDGIVVIPKNAVIKPNTMIIP